MLSGKGALASSFFLRFVIKWNAAGLGAMSPQILRRALGLWDNEEKKGSMALFLFLIYTDNGTHASWYFYGEQQV